MKILAGVLVALLTLAVSVEAQEISVGGLGKANPAYATQIGCDDGTNLQALSCGAGSTLKTQAAGATTTVCVTPTVTAGSYVANDIVGGLLTFTNAFRASVLSGTLGTVRVLDKAGQAVAYDFIPISAALTGGTVANDGAATILDADLSKILPAVSISSQIAFADNGYSYSTASTPIVSGDTSLRALLITRGAPTYASTSDVTVCITVWQD